MSRALDITGQRYGRLVAIERAENKVSKSGKVRARWLCQCDCGNKKIVLLDDLRGGQTKSCGCLSAEISSKKSKTHGMSGTRIYVEWASMKARCYNKESKSYNRYGGRGIRVCQEWLDDFMNFYNWAMANGYRDDLTIERKDVNGNYCPENCCWITAKEQAKNRRTTLKTRDKNGNEVYAMDIAEENGIPMNVVIARKSSGWDLNKALNTPLIEQTIKRKVLQISLDTGNVIAEYESIGEASRKTRTERSSISRCCLGERNKAGGYAWRYAGK